MVDLKRLKVLEKKLDVLLDLVNKTKHEIKDELEFLRRSHYRDMNDQWQFAKDLSHPVTGKVTPKEGAELLVMTLCNRDRGDS